MHTWNELHTQLCIDRGNLHTSWRIPVGLRSDRRLLLDADFHNVADREQCYLSLFDERDECGA